MTFSHLVVHVHGTTAQKLSVYHLDVLHFVSKGVSRQVGSCFAASAYLFMLDSATAWYLNQLY